ncbi:hypothetical protein WS95_04290 [Burkholderia sp. MSMB1826]|nr:hypothetical protein WS95_04290 [Burkholderia sp. MSMB1826]
MKSFPEAITTVFPETTIQACIVHLIRNFLDFASWKGTKSVAAELTEVYRAPPALLQSNLPVIGARARVGEVQHVVDLEHGVGHAVDQEVVQVGVFPAEGRQQDMVQLAQRLGSFDLDPAPDGRLDVLKLHVQGKALERFRHLISG